MPAWRYTVDVSHVFHDDDKSFEEKRDEIVATLRRSTWVKAHGNGTLGPLIDVLAETQDTEEFDEHWDQVYDMADIQRAWIQTR